MQPLRTTTMPEARRRRSMELLIESNRVKIQGQQAIKYSEKIILELHRQGHLPNKKQPG
jgi:hypothetical protein